MTTPANTGTGPFDQRGAPDPSPFAGDDDPTDDPTPLEADYRMDPRHLQSVGLVPKNDAGPRTEEELAYQQFSGKSIDVDPPVTKPWHERLALLDRITAYVRSVRIGQSCEIDHVRRLMEMGS